MYKENVTSYWYLFRCSHRSSGDATEEFLDGSKMERTRRRKGRARIVAMIVVCSIVVVFLSDEW